MWTSCLTPTSVSSAPPHSIRRLFLDRDVAVMSQYIYLIYDQRISTEIIRNTFDGVNLIGLALENLIVLLYELIQSISLFFKIEGFIVAA